MDFVLCPSYLMKTINKKAKFNYKLFETIEAGIVLMGGEVKSARAGKTDLTNSHAKIMEDEVFLINANIPVEGKKNYNPTRMRKLLLHKKQILSIKTKIKAKKLTLIPTKMYTKARLIKVELALAKGKQEYQKKESIKAKDIDRDTQRELRGEKDNESRI